MGALALFLTCLAPLAAELEAVPLSPGVTSLGDIGLYQVAYRSANQPPVAMPLGWTGWHDSVSGVCYVPNQLMQGREALLIHVPWRVPSGPAWVDYRLKLPAVKTIDLAFSTAMRPDAIGPDKGDGVTFSAYVVDGEPRELLREHRDEAIWRDHRFDLSAYAGREVTVRLQVEPGPANNASFDFSYFGEPRIDAGQAADPQSAVQELCDSKAIRATAKADLRRAANTRDQGILPSNLLDGVNRLERAGDGYRLVYQGDDATVVYQYAPRTGTLDDWTVSVDGGRSFPPAVDGGFYLARPETPRATGGQAVSVTPDLAARRLTVVWRYPAETGGLTATWRFGIRGKALTIEASAAEPTVARFSLGRVGAAPLRRAIEVPYLHGAVIWLPADKLYVNRCLDWMVTNSSACPQGEATYNALTDGRRNLVSEAGYVAVSPLLPEVLPNLPRPASPYLEQLGPKIMWDVWGHFKNSYRGDAEILRELKDNGVDHLAIIQHVWQRYGYDVKLPDHLPPNPDWGGHEGLVEFGRAANECGYVWSLHENYIDLYPDAPSYDPSARVLRADGSPSPAWFNKGTRVQSFGLKANRALGFAERTAPEAHRLYGTNAAYLDVHTCVPPWHQLDHDATQPMAGMCRGKVEWDTALFEYMRRAHQGPLFGEGHWQMYWAGACDGVEAQVDGGEDHRPLLEFDLLKLHPQMVNHGMGYYARWFRQGYNAQWGEDVGNVAHYDQYRAQEIAYGHAGFIGSEQTFNTQWVAKEHHLMYPVQRLYGTARVTDIAYEVSGRLVPSSVAAALGETWRQRITYDSGLTVYVNWAKEPWTISGRVLPRWGVLALGPGTEVSTSLRNGVLADYVDCPDYLFADARTSFTLPHASRLQVEPKLTGFRYLGDDKIELTYTWQVDQELDRDYAAFVHFVSPNPPADDEGIMFQGDHALPRPTRTWRPGERLTDGPWVVTVPTDKGDRFDITIGLFAGPRARLRGPSLGRDKILLGHLTLTRTDGRITGASVSPPTAAEEAPARLDFTAHLNPAGTWVDFGPLATNGSVKVERGPRELIVLPYPRGRVFGVKLDLAAIQPGATAAPAKVAALAAGTRQPLGEVPSRLEGGRLVFEVGLKGAGAYRVSW